MAFTQITVTGTFQNSDGTPASGGIRFTPTAVMRNGTSATEINARTPVHAQVVNGVLSAVTLAATTDPGTTPTGVTYEVSEHLTGQQRLTYHIAVPHDGGAISLDTHPRAQEAVPNSIVFPVPGPTGPEGPAGPIGPPGEGSVDSVNGDPGPNVVLTKASVGLGAVDNVSAVSLRDRSTHTGTQTSTTISDFTEAVQDAVAGVLAAGTNVALTYDDAANTLTVAATGAGGLDAEAVRDAIGVALVGVGNVAVTVNDAADTITISTTATVNSTDTALRDRTTHTGVQPISTVTGLQTTLDGLPLRAANTDLTGAAVGALLAVSAITGGVASAFELADTTPVTPGDIGAQPADADLTAIAALTPANDDLIQRKAGAWTNRTIAQVKTDLAIPDPVAAIAPRAGYYFFPISGHAGSTSAALGSGTLRVTPMLLRAAVTLTRLAAEVTVAGEVGALVRLGIWADNGNGYPGALVVDAGPIAGDVVAVAELTINSVLPAGIYWFGAAVQAAPTTQPTVRTVDIDLTPPVPLPISTSLPSAGATGVGLSATGVTGAFAASFPAGATVTVTAPRLIAKAL